MGSYNRPHWADKHTLDIVLRIYTLKKSSCEVTLSNTTHKHLINQARCPHKRAFADKNLREILTIRFILYVRSFSWVFSPLKAFW